jgi:putative ATPase
VAETTGAAFEELSAVSATVKDVREVLARARERLGGSGQRTILFLDEIHRFNKAQQDALLPAVEEGLVTLIGATTENPYFEVNSALLSRCQIYELVPLEEEELQVIVRRGADALETAVPDEIAELIALRAGGDARNALNIVELADQTARAEGTPIAEQHVEDAARKRPLVYDKGGDAHYDFISAFIKSMRGSARRPARGEVEPRAGGHLPRASAEVERVLRSDQGGDGRRRRARAGAASRLTA